MKPELQEKFFEYLNGEVKIQDLENWIYSSQELENILGEDTYTALIEFNFKDKYSEALLVEFLLTKTIKEGDFLEWKIKRLLKEFIDKPQKAKELLDEIYNFSTSTYNSSGEIAPGFKFLQNLGLNNFYWMDEGYLKTNYGKKWQIEYKKYKDKIPYYHNQLEPIARQILQAMEEGEIKIKNRGSYSISDELKSTLESQKIFEIKEKSC